MANIKLLIAILLSAALNCFGQKPVSSEFIDSLVEESMTRFPQAAVGVAVIENGKVTHLKGYGVLNAKTGEKANEESLFAIASNSKAFTTTALGMLVDQGKLNWTDRVVDHVPEFKMYDPYITANFTIIDLLTHRSGLGLGAGDLMIFPDGGDFTIEDIVKSFQYQTPVSDFRTKYDYDNLLYIVAGEVVHRISGKPWDQFIEEEIMIPLDMKSSVGMYTNLEDPINLATPHKTENGEVIPLEQFVDKNSTFAAAAGIYSNVTDLSKWVLMHLNEGKYGNDLSKTLISKESHDELWKIHTVISYHPVASGTYSNHYSGYGLGFNLQDQKGYTIVSHTGGLPGMISMITMIPEQKAGIIILTNADPGGMSIYTLTNEIKDEIIDGEEIDWISLTERRLEERQSNADSVLNAVWKIVEKSKKKKIDHSKYTGYYNDDWFGKINIQEKENGDLWFASLRSPRLNGKMHYYQANTFVIEWEYNDMECDAFAMFRLDENGFATSIKLKGISPLIDFSFDFHDLNLKRINP